MYRYKLQKILALVLLVGAIISIFIFASSDGIVYPEAKNGVFDLSQWDFNKNSAIELSGEWELFWNQFVKSEQFLHSEKPEPTTLDYLPQWWNYDDKLYPKYPNGGYATYHLRVIVPESEVGSTFVMHTIDNAFSFVLYIDKTLILQRGRISDSNRGYSPYYENVTAGFIIPASSFNITIHISMYNDRNGGIARSFQMGRSSTMRKNNRSVFLFDAFLIGILTILSIYHFLLFSLRISDRSPLYFAGMCAIFLLRTLFQNSKIIYHLFPLFDQNLFIKLWYGSYYMLIPSFVLFFHSLYPKQLHRLLAIVCIVISTIFTVITFATPLSFFSSILNYYHLLFVLMSVYLIYAIIKAIVAKEVGAEIMLIGLLVILLFAGNDILHNVGLLNTGYYVAYGFILFILTQTYLISLRFSIAFSRVEVLSGDLSLVNKKLTRLNSMKDEFLANTSHELRTPLNGIIGIAESLSQSDKYCIDNYLQDNLHLIISSGKRLSFLVNDLLDFSRMKNDELILHKKQINLHEQVCFVLEHFKHICTHKNILLINLLDHEKSIIIADENRIQQVLFNLIGNAVKFTETGSITIAGKKIDQSGEDFYSVSIKDTGIGISKEQSIHIFDPFRQGDGSITRLYGGTGLGLSISQILIERHNGFIEYSSQPRSGSEFTFFLPVNSYSDSDTLEQIIVADKEMLVESNNTQIAELDHYREREIKLIQPPREAIQNSTIMVVDDDPINVTIISNQVKKNDSVRIIEASNGEEALEFLKLGEKPDIVLLDIMMPKMSGYEVARSIRQQYKIFDMPIIMLTAKDSIHDIVTAFQSGANDYIRKPFNSYELIARINTLLSLKKAIGEREKLVSIEEDIAIAKEIQNNALNSSIPFSNKYRINVTYVPVTDIGGDFYGFHKIDDNHLGILIADVNGHGIHAALIASMIKIIFSTLFIIAHNPVQFLTELNNIIMNNTEHSYLTALYAVLDLENMTLNFSRAGHDPILVYRKKTNQLITKKTAGRIIGYSSDVNFEIGTIHLEPGDRIICATDGIVETLGPNSEVYGEKRFFEMIKKSGSQSGDQFSQALIENLNNWSENENNFNDDITLVTIDI